MDSEINYIDKLTKDKLKGFESLPDTNWDKFNSNLSGSISPDTSFMSNLFFGNINVGRVVYIAASLTILTTVTTGTFLYQEKENTLIKTYKAFKLKKNSNTSAKTYKIKEIIKSNTKKEENVVVRVKVPIRKKIVVRKEIKITDSVK